MRFGHKQKKEDDDVKRRAASPDKAFEGSWLGVDTERYPVPLLLLQDELMNDLCVGKKRGEIMRNKEYITVWFTSYMLSWLKEQFTNQLKHFSRVHVK